MKRGIKIGDYTLVELLSTGGMGQVWLAHREFEGGGRTAVAIKFPHAAGVLDVRIREGLHEEARMQMQLQHDNIPRVRDMGVHQGLPYFVMDYIAGRSLAQLLTRMRDIGTPLRFELTAHIAREIGYALRYAHGFEIDGASRQVIHRDVAPKNVLLSGQGGVFMVDFGVSEAVGFQSSRNHIKGTLLYMAPEHALGFPTPKSDGWGLGAILWEMIEGRQFRGEIEAEDLRRAANEGRCGSLSRLGIPEVLRFVIEGLLRVDERERLTLDEVLRPLEGPEFPTQRTVLADLLKRRFGGSVHRSGQTMVDFVMPEQLDRTLAAAKVVEDAGPRGLEDDWGTEAFAAAGVPAVVATGGTRPIPRAVALDDDEESGPRRVGAGRVEPVRAERGEPASDPRAATAREPRVPDGGAEDGRPQRTEQLPRVPFSGAREEEAPVRTEPVPPPSGAREREQPREGDAPVPRPQGQTRRATDVAPAAGSEPTPVLFVGMPEPVLPVMEEAEPLPMDVSTGGISHPLDITEVWEVEARVPVAVTSQSEVPTDQEQPPVPVEPPAEARPGKRRAASGVMWVDVDVDHDAVPSVPTVPALPSQPAAAPVSVPVAASGPVRVGPERRAKGPFTALLAVMLWLGVGGGLLWAVWPGGPEREGGREEKVAVVVPTQEPAVPERPAPVVVEPATAPAGVEPGPTVEPAPAPVEVTEPASAAEPESEAVEAAQSAEPVLPTEPATTEPATTEPELPVEPKPTPTAEPKRISKPVRKKASKPQLPLPPSRITIKLRVGAPMDIEFDGVHRSLTVRAPLAKIAITPRRVTVRWRRPTGEWKRRKVEIKSGVDYEVDLDPSGPTFTPVPRKAP